MSSPLLSARLRQSGTLICLTLPSRPDRWRELPCQKLTARPADDGATKPWLNNTKRLKPLVHSYRQEGRVVSADPQEPTPFVCRQVTTFSHRRSPFIIGEFDSPRHGKRRMVGSTDKRPGVVKNLPALAGTGGGSLAQDIPEIEIFN